jgi:hypothetical protein
MQLPPPTDDKERLAYLDEIVARTFGEGVPLNPANLALLLYRLRQLPRAPRMVPVTPYSNIYTRTFFPFFKAGFAIPIRVETNIPATPHELTLHDAATDVQVWPAVGSYPIPPGAYDSYGIADLDVAAGVTQSFSAYIMKLWVNGVVVSEVEIYTFW